MSDKRKKPPRGPCGRKRRHPNRTSAERYAQRLSLWHVVYRCHFCGGWHVGRVVDEDDGR